MLSPFRLYVCVCVLYCRVTEVSDISWVLYQYLIMSNQLNVNWNSRRKILESWPVAVVSTGNASTGKRYSHWGIFWNHDCTKFAIAATFFHNGLDCTTDWSKCNSNCLFFLYCHFRFLPSLLPIVYISSVAYPGIFFGGVGWTNSVEGRGQKDQGSGVGSPIVSGSGGSCNLVKETSFHIVNFS
jgi:hypothetical protein